jgi:hypothetical protein
LFGPYTTPLVDRGSVVFCEVRGEVTVCGLTDTRIPWPTGKRGRARTYIVFAGLADAIRREAAAAVCHWWGVTPQTVTKWRKALGVPQHNEGTLRLARVKILKGLLRDDVKARALANANTPEANAKKAAAKRGVPRPDHVKQALRSANLGRRLSAATRAKMKATHQRRLSGGKGD